MCKALGSEAVVAMTPTNEAAEVIAKARHRYLHDAEFHAKVEMTVGVVEAGRGTMTEPERAAALHAAAVILLVVEEALS